jgi:glycine/D-amino acid oxidase-like deaminating enzyme/nitrite reductase/ring-hydroxylating ferredoxin subunit
VNGYLFLGPSDRRRMLEDELEAAQRAYVDCAMLERAPHAPFDTGPCIEFRRQGQFHPLEYLVGLAAAIEANGGRIYTQTHATVVVGGADAVVETRTGHAVRAGSIVVATNTPINDLFAIHTKQAPYMTYVIAFAVDTHEAHHALYWDTADPYHYVRFQRLGGADGATREMLIVGGEDHKSGQEQDQEERFVRLERWARTRFRDGGPVEYRWSGQVMETQDGLAFIGRNPLDQPNVYVATGDSGMGMTHGTIAGILIGDLIAGRENLWATLYDPTRKRAGAIKDFLKENLNVVAQYADHVRPSDVTSIDEIEPGTGAVLQRGALKSAVYKDTDGHVFELSAICRHLGCVVAWNSSDSTWDCPCHGSRFDRYGRVITGPANSNLAPVADPQ